MSSLEILLQFISFWGANWHKNLDSCHWVEESLSIFGVRCRIVCCQAKICRSFMIVFEWHHWLSGCHCRPARPDRTNSWKSWYSLIDTSTLWFCHCGRWQAYRLWYQTSDCYTAWDCISRAAKLKFWLHCSCQADTCSPFSSPPPAY